MTIAHRTTLMAALAVCTAVPVRPAAAQDRRPMTLVDLLDVPSLTDPELSPDGTQLLYVLSTADWEANRRITHIWRVDTDGTGSVQMTNGAEGENSPRWSPDGTHIAFLTRRDDTDATQIYLISNAGGEARQLTEHETSVSSIAWSGDGAFVYFMAADAKTDDEKARDEAKDDVFAFDEDYKQRHLWRVAVDAGTEERITTGDHSVVGYRLSRDGSKIAYHRAPNPLFGYYDRGEVWVMDISSGNAVMLTENGVWENGAELSPDNSQVLFLSDANEGFEPYYNDKIFIAPAGGGEARRLLNGSRFEVQNASWSADGRSVYFVANVGVRTDLFRVDVNTERLTRLTEGDHALRGWRFDVESGAHVFGIDERTNPGDIWIFRDGGEPSRITHVFDYLAQQFTLPRQERIEWSGTDGTTVEGLLFYPLDYREGERYPLVVQTHGGPASSDKFGFQSSTDYVQVLTAKGYAVLQPNYRGSTGYGDDFLRDMVGHYFRQAHLDVMSGADHVIAMGIADGERMVKMGWSAGGHMTNKIITFTDRFKAASSGAGAVNWISMYAQSDVRTYRTPWFGGTPWQRNAPIDAYWDHSPLKDVWKVKTPTLVLVGQNDPRVPMPQSVELYRALKANGVPTHLYVAPREAHGWRELRHRLFKMNVELDWFERHAMNRSYTWEQVPAEAGDKTARTSVTSGAR